MRAQTQTIDRRPQGGVPVNISGLDWFDRLWQWLRNTSQRRRELGPVCAYGTWDARRERFQPLRADSAADIVMARSTLSWSTGTYTGEI
jgi:hypothetical protein